MDNTVTIKGYSHGITVILNPDTDYETLKQKVAVKFRESAKFLGNTQMALRFEGRKLSGEEQIELLNIITRECNLNIVCIACDDETEDGLFVRALEKADLSPSDQTVSKTLQNARFYKGNLRSGMEMTFEENALIIGDVNPGASVNANGSIIILGSLKGNAVAGMGGNENAFVLALDMAPVQIRIAQTIARSPDHPARSESKEAQIAFLEDGAIYIEPVSKKVLSERTI
ncbi:MAG: septum site-determining protein MinC [Lachnospiraceae bacterium]|nr:septum site-determining protein MinC [Lachnospiraceae bacterium]